MRVRDKIWRTQFGVIGTLNRTEGEWKNFWPELALRLPSVTDGVLKGWEKKWPTV